MTALTTTPATLTLEDAATLLGADTGPVKRMVDNGVIRVVRIPGVTRGWLLIRSDVEALAAKQATS